ncbi:mitogen-activated protein kinase kinase kinase YODA-like [Glycine soja]|uniref:mitogen-activated protein kinase kinase kinase n=2 Tax=Glycine soja TaxID=3848 RepID=A0A0B2QNP1_GLYSO|nr:mitogen-activated protein kinase kinase kinase YODA-like [Glycine soja]XP_028182920.1 mitogen-activated protein kinase kinase kinase YODA-like [Glycine soja]KHN21769.1 Mitogen-activated protein kinase kinase kinase ANP1 [Glycine soja]RZB88727.1 Mitogen-activated protein kinase kinase kinase YODA isoform A [Glycine soja]RZB88728.1 Mitogen-activated protein kinase kinase kinase YODA isoform B [Glycine soja]
MLTWWGKSSSKKTKKKANKESFFDTLHRKLRISSEGKVNIRSGGSRRHYNDTISEKGDHSPSGSRSPSPSKVARCQSFIDRPHAQPLPLPGLHPSSVGRVDSEISISSKSRLEKVSKPSLFLPLPTPGCIRCRPNPADLDGDMVTPSVFSDCSADSDEPADSHNRSPLATDCETGTRTAAGSPSSSMLKDQPPTVSLLNSTGVKKPGNILSNHMSSTSPKHRPLRNHVPNLQVPPHGAFYSTPDSSLSSPSRSPLRAFGTDQVLNSAFLAGKPYPEVNFVGSGHCSSPGSGHNSGYNSMGGDMSGPLLWQPSRGSPEYSPVPSPRMTSPGPSSRIQSGAVTPIHPKAGGTPTESQTHRLPLPPLSVSNSSPFSHSNSAATSPSMPRSPARADNPSSGSRWKKGKLLGSGSFGHVYLGFNSESGEMCAVKEVTLFSDDPKSMESAKQFMQEIHLLSRLQHPNIVQYYGSETVDDKLYIYLEYVSGGSIHKLLQEYGQFGELVIRSYTQQILSGLAYLHAKNTLHRDIKGANILVDPTGRVKLADFGMAKHITGQSCLLSFKGTPYWMAPEVIKNSNGCNLAVDIWSLGCTVLEMATTKPPWFQYEAVAAMFKIGNSKELPTIPDHLSNEGKDFVRKCLQRNPYDRPSACELLDHPFVKNAAPLERPILAPEVLDPVSGIIQGAKALAAGQGKNLSSLDSDRLSIHSSRFLKTNPRESEIHIPRNISCPVSPIGSPLLRSRSPQHRNGKMSPPISSPRTASGASTPLAGGSGAIPFGNHSKQPIYFQEGFGSIPKSSNGVYINGHSHHDSSVDIFRGMQIGSHIQPELVSSENDVLVNQFARHPHAEPYDFQSVLADRVGRQLLREHVKINPSIDLSPNSSLLSRPNGL